MVQIVGALAMGADASFVARSMDRDPKHLQQMLLRSHGHKGSSFLEIYQNCNIFNDAAFEIFTEKGSKPVETLFLEQGRPLVFGAQRNKGIRLEGFRPTVVDLGGDVSEDLAVENDFGRFQAFHESAVGQAGFANGGVNADLPEVTERALFGAAIAIRVLATVIDGVRGVTVKFGALEAEALGSGKHSPATFAGGR